MKPKLADLLADMNESNRRPEVDFGPPVGREFPNGYGSPLKPQVRRYEDTPSVFAVLRDAFFPIERPPRPLRRITDGR